MEEKEAIALYVSGVANELRRDEFMHRALGIEKYSKVVVPRVEKLIFLVKSFLPLFPEKIREEIKELQEHCDEQMNNAKSFK